MFDAVMVAIADSVKSQQGLLVVVVDALQRLKLAGQCRAVENGLRDLVVVHSVGIGCAEIDLLIACLADGDCRVAAQQFKLDHVLDAMTGVADRFAKKQNLKPGSPRQYFPVVCK